MSGLDSKHCYLMGGWDSEAGGYDTTINLEEVGVRSEVELGEKFSRD